MVRGGGKRVEYSPISVIIEINKVEHLIAKERRQTILQISSHQEDDM